MLGDPPEIYKLAEKVSISVGGVNSMLKQLSYAGIKGAEAGKKLGIVFKEHNKKIKDANTTKRTITA